MPVIDRHIFFCIELYVPVVPYLSFSRLRLMHRYLYFPAEPSLATASIFACSSASLMPR